jgi:hypothetical protein
MGGSRKGSVLQFLYESGLIYKEATLLGEATLFKRVFSNLLSEGLTGPSEGFRRR